MSELDMNELTKKLTPDYKAGKACYYQREENVNVNNLMNELSERADDLKAQHEAEAAAAQERQNQRRVQHPDQYEKMMQERKALNPDQPDEPAGMTDAEKREAWKRTLKAAEQENIRQTGVKVYNDHGIFCGYAKK